ncbi:MAG: hypothetical protein AseanaTS_03800 [Candidatus Pelagadaptatus aseana]|uniref:hypothetical protein n=1 Tax=Candidatus Pelagadaptatus aseana TaxID=3120508 RepID=UPI0039B2791A
MDPRLILGKCFSEIADSISHSGIEAVYEHLEEGEDQEYCVSSESGAWEISLGKNDIVETVFLYDVVNFSKLFGFGINSTQEQIVSILGNPTTTGGPDESEIFGNTGKWLRYDLDSYSLHIEYEFNSNKIKLITLMLPEIAP